MERMFLNTVVMVTLTIGSIFAQQRFGDEYPRFKGFLKSETEHIMQEYEGTPEIRSVCGRIIEASSGVGIPKAIFEIRSENPEEQVRGTKTNSKGEFRLRSMQEGVYIFKVTKNGFQSVFGKLKISRKAQPSNVLTIELRQGV